MVKRYGGGEYLVLLAYSIRHVTPCAQFPPDLQKGLANFTTLVLIEWPFCTTMATTHFLLQ